MDGSIQVVYSAAVQAALRDLITQALQQGNELGQKALAAVRAIDARLRTDPRGFGEPCYHLSEMRLEVRLAVVLPLSVTFAVHEEKPLVFVTGHRLLTGC